MALIKCPECGTEVSDKANSCPRCGFPIQNIQNSNIIKVKLPPPPFENSIGNWKVYDSRTDELIVKANPRQIIEIESTTEKTVKLRFALSKFYEFSLKPGKKYDFKLANGMFVPKLVCNEVEFFDAD